MSRHLLIFAILFGLANCLPTIEKREAQNIQNCAFSKCNQNNLGGGGFGGRPSGFGGRPSGYGGRPSGYGGRPSGYGGRPSGFGGGQLGFGFGFGRKKRAAQI